MRAWVGGKKQNHHAPELAQPPTQQLAASSSRTHPAHAPTHAQPATHSQPPPTHPPTATHPEADCKALCEVEGDGVQRDVQVFVDDVGLRVGRKKVKIRWKKGGGMQVEERRWQDSGPGGPG